MSSDRGFLLNGLAKDTVLTYDCGKEKISIVGKMKVVPLAGSSGPSPFVEVPREISISFTAGGNTRKLRRVINKELRKQRRRKMFGYRELTRRGWAVLTAIGAAIIALIYFVVR